MSGLVEFYSAKTGVKDFDGEEEFEPPQMGLTQKVIQISENMKNKCDDKFRNESDKFDSEEIEVKWFNCINEAQEWKTRHLP